jgi:large subunit ribosomal protein L30
MRIAVIRIKGKFTLRPSVKFTLANLRLDRSYACVLLPEGETAKGMLQACKDVVSFGPVDKETVSLLLSRRGKTLEGSKLSDSKKPEEIEKLAAEVAGSQKKLEEFGVSSVFFLSPPKGGFGRRKAHVPYGPIGKNPEIADLISRMA